MELQLDDVSHGKREEGTEGLALVQPNEHVCVEWRTDEELRYMQSKLRQSYQVTSTLHTSHSIDTL